MEIFKVLRMKHPYWLQQIPRQQKEAPRWSKTHLHDQSLVLFLLALCDGEESKWNTTVANKNRLQN